MNFSDFLRRATSSLKFWDASATTAPDAPPFQLEAVTARLERLQVPEPKEPIQIHSLVKLAPIPVPRAVRWESQAINLFAWACTAAMAWGGFQVDPDWLVWYGMAAVAVFAVLFRLEGPRTRAEHLQRSAEVARCHEAYLQSEARLREVLTERFEERKEEFHTLRNLYEQACQEVKAVEAANSRTLMEVLSNPLRTASGEAKALAEQVDALECQMVALVGELEDFSTIHKKAIDAAIMARHNARLAYWQAKLDEAALTGESVQPH